MGRLGAFQICILVPDFCCSRKSFIQRLGGLIIYLCVLTLFLGSPCNYRVHNPGAFGRGIALADT